METVPVTEFKQLMLGELDAVNRMAHHLARSSNEAEDLVQETYLRAFRSRETFRLTEFGPRPWLFKILHNVYRTRLSRGAREAPGAEDLEDRAAAPEPVLADLDWEHVDERLKKAVESLAPSYKSVLLLWAVEGMKYREIAEVLEVAIGTVMSRLFRARQLLTEQLAGLAAEKRLTPAPVTEGNGEH